MDFLMTMMAMEIIMEEDIPMGTQTTTMRGAEAMMTITGMAIVTMMTMGIVTMMTMAIVTMMTMGIVTMMTMGMATVTIAMGISVRGERVTTVTRMSINTAT